MFTVLHKWDNYNAHSMDLVAKYLYQYFDTQTTEKLCLLFNMLEANTSNDPNHSRWEADDRWIVHADDVAEIEWPGEKRLKRKHHQIANNPIHNNDISHPHPPLPPGVGEEDEKRTKAKRWDTFSKFLARIGFLKSSSKKSMAWVCSWNDTSGVFNRSKLVNAAQSGPSIYPTSPHPSHPVPAPSPIITIPSTPISPQIPLSPHTPFVSSAAVYSPPARTQDYHNSQYSSYTPPSPPPHPLLPALNSASDGVSVAYQSDSVPFTLHSPPPSTNSTMPAPITVNHTINTSPHQYSYNSTHSSSHLLNSNTSALTYNNTSIERLDSPNPHHHFPSAIEYYPQDHENSGFAPLSNSAEKVAPSYPPATLLSSYMRDIQESPFEYYENRGCVHAVNPINILSTILKYLRVRVHRNWENFSFTQRARVEANKQLIETVKESNLEHVLTRIPVIKIMEGGSISSQIRRQFPSGRTWEPEEYKSILQAVLSAPINQHVILRQRNLKFKSEKIQIKEVKRETSKGEFRLWSHIEPDTQLAFPPALPSITQAYRYKDAFLHVATGLNLDSITHIKYGNQPLKFVKSKTVMIILTQDEEELETARLMKGIQHVGHNEYPVVPQIVNVNLMQVPKEGTILFGSYLKYVETIRHDSQEPESFPSPERNGNGSTSEYRVVSRSSGEIKSESIEFTVLHPNALCAHTTHSPETLTAKSYFVCGQYSFLGFHVNDSLL